MWLRRVVNAIRAGPPATGPPPVLQAVSRPNPDAAPLHEAAASGDAALVDRLLAAGYSPHALKALKKGSGDDWAQPHTPLFYAACAGHVPLTHTLLRAGAACAPSEARPLGRELYRAAVMCKPEAIQALRAAGAELDGPCSELLYAQAWGGDVATVQCWVAAGAVLDAEMQERGRDELIAGITAADLPVVQRWLAAGVDPNAARDAEGRTPQQLAASMPEIARALCETPLNVVAGRGQAGSLRSMLQSGAAAQLDAAARANLLATALKAGVRGEWLAACLLPEGYVAAECLQLWAAAAHEGQPQGALWVRASLLALSRWGLPAELAQRTLGMGLVV